MTRRSPPRLRGPTAFAEIQKHNRGPLPKPPAVMFQEEPRETAWAEAMEKVLTKRLEAAAMEAIGIKGLKVSALECRTSMCRLAIDWPPELADELVKSNRISKPTEGAIHYIMRMSGPLSSGWQRFFLPNDGRGQLSEGHDEVLLMFSEEHLDPDQYLAWARRKAAEYDAQRRAQMEPK